MIPIRKSRRSYLQTVDGATIRVLSASERKRLLRLAERVAFQTFLRRAERKRLYARARQYGMTPRHARDFAHYVSGVYREHWERENALRTYERSTHGTERTAIYGAFVPIDPSRDKRRDPDLTPVALRVRSASESGVDSVAFVPSPTMRRVHAARQYHRDGFYLDRENLDAPEPTSDLVPADVRSDRINALVRALDRASAVVLHVLSDWRAFQHAIMAFASDYHDLISGQNPNAPRWTLPIGRAERTFEASKHRRKVAEVIRWGRTVRIITRLRRLDRVADLRPAPYIGLVDTSYTGHLTASGRLDKPYTRPRYKPDGMLTPQGAIKLVRQKTRSHETS